MLSESLKKYQANAQHLVYGYHRIAYWDSMSAEVKSPDDVMAHVNADSKQTVTTKTLIFLHGFPSASWDWHYQWNTLQQQYRCVAFDMLGFGLSDKPKKHRYSIMEQADIALYLCRKLGIRESHVIAHDYGVSVAQELLYKQQNKELSLRIASICFLNGGLFSEMHRPLFTQKLLHSAFGPIMVRLMSKITLQRSFTKIFGRNSPPQAHEVDTLWHLLNINGGNLVLPKLLDYLDDRDVCRDRWVNSMQQTDIPFAFINGVQDPISGKHMLNRFKTLFPESPTKALDVGHYPQLEARQRVTDLLQQFLTTKQLD